MFCKKCGKEIPDGAKFCDGCGAQTNAANEEINASGFQAAMNNSCNVTVATKKKVSTKKVILIICGLLFLAFCIYAMTMDDESTSSNDSYFEENFSDSEENVIKALAISEIRDDISVTHDQDVYNVKIVDQDGKFNYIVSASTESKQGFETWWCVLIKIDTETEKLLRYIHYHGEDDWNKEIDGGRFTKDNIPEFYKTNEEFGWGEENHIE